MRHRVPEQFLKVAQDEKANAELIAGLDNVLALGQARELQQDHLGDGVFTDYFLKLIGCPEHRNSSLAVVDLVIRDQPDCAQADLGLAQQPILQLCRVAAGTNQKCSLLSPENPAGQQGRKIVIRKKQRDVEPGYKIKEKYSGYERVLRGNQIEY